MPDLDIDKVTDEIGATLFGASEEVVEDAPIVEDAPEIEDAPVVDAPQVRAAPKSWAKEKHELWNQLAPEAQEQIELREKQILDGFSQYKEHSDVGKAIVSAAAPYQDMLRQQGIDAPKAFSTLLAAHARLTSGTPEQRMLAYQELGRNLGLSQPTQGDPMVQEAYRAAMQSQQALQKFQQERMEEVRRGKEVEVDEFAKDKPYFDELADDMVVFINAGMSLQDAYDRAMWANPVTRAKETERIRQESDKSLRDKARQAGTGAKKASAVNVRSRDTGKTPTEPLGKMEDTMKKTLTEIRERAH